MSVINQMLKDLEQRSPEPNAHSVQPGHVESSYSPIKIALLSGISVFGICLISFYVWQLVSENTALKAEKISNQVTQQISNQTTSRANALQSSQKTPLNKLDLVENKTYQAAISIAKPQQDNKQINKNENLQVILPTKVDVSGPRTLDKVSANHNADNNSQRIAVEPLVNNDSSRVTPAKKTAVIVDEHSHLGTVSSHNHDVANGGKTESRSNANKMSVSRRQLSADELAEQKLTLAEKALSAKQIEQAEKLLEEVVILKPNDSQTRKKLAALWFGRQAYQDAVNLLSQGIALNSKDSSLRQMKARIHLRQGQVVAALNTLKPLAQLKDEQYQIMLANTAQQAQQNEVAVEAYKVLIAMQPDIGRWYLGLAVLHDKNSQFTLANKAYKQALTKNDLSVSSVNFVEQRIQAIGQ
ncbi:tetratricopeptide repeat protein [Colwellia sp. 12G3]|uniref:tetratricopeptide repeat protein n=1 Tax=Colwellia sp. 12G3 TaxID=2058299 RepID=UPI000C32482C|nr:tetratricopeptide repeat protein [Colwellia sp. 12G3]PKI13159.1 MSHA biogenesis protein MshN [Colwellia sp. 12G3]